MLIDKKLKRIFIRHTIIFVLCVAGITSLGSFLLKSRGSQDLMHREFQHELELLAYQDSFNITMKVEHIKAISSRTMIRKALYKYQMGESTFSELKNYTAPKYADGLRVYKDIVYASRSDSSGNIVASFGTSPFLPFSESQSDPVSIIDSDGIVYICIIQPIIHNGMKLGYDKGVFRLRDSRPPKARLVTDSRIIKTQANGTAISYPIGETGYSLIGTLTEDKQILKPYKEAMQSHFILHAIVVIIIVVMTSYFTIIKPTSQLVEQLDKANKVILKQQRFSAFGQISSHIIHEYNNIMTGILGYAEILHDRFKNDSDISSMTRIILDNGNRSCKLLRKLLDFSSNSLIQMKDVNIIPFFNSHMDDFNQFTDVSLTFVSLNRSDKFRIDPILIRRALINLIENSIEAECSRIMITVSRLKQSGFETITPEQALEPFISSKIKGYGLGLSQAYGIFRQHQGHIEINNLKPHGARISIILN